MKNIFKKITKKKIVVFIVLIFIIFEIINISTDIYNFRQLGKVKEILKDLKREDKQFFYLKDFNEIYNTNIKPIRNCYYIRNYKNNDRVPYTFGFELYSIIFKIIYGTNYYIYPKYDLPITTNCVMGGGCIDITRKSFEYTISNPCRD